MSSQIPAFTIRRATIGDVERIAEILVAAWKWAYASFVPADLMAERTDKARRLERILNGWDQDSLTLVGVDSAGIVWGFATEHTPCQLEGYDAEIGALYVHPEANRTGMGTALVRAMADDFRSRGARSMAIHTLAKNEIGCRFYTKLDGIRSFEDIWNGLAGVWFVWPSLDTEGRW